ncbi:MAG: hypothetical protein HW400_908 [Candidatus Levybacteria bacterium]|nr:hypothetical protein [Candidatus Levybacteria bacterium]
MVEDPNFRLNIVSRGKETDVTPEQRVAINWYEFKAARLPQMKIEKSTVTGLGGWEVQLTKENQVELISGKHFSIEGIKVSTPSNFWNQPLMIQRSEKVVTDKGEIERISGIVLIITDPKGRIFVEVGQEPGVKSQTGRGNEVHPIVRTPFQSSVEKMRQLSNGEEKADPILFNVLRILSKDGSGDISSIIQGIPFRKVPTDGNRIESNVLYGVLKLTTEEADIIFQEVPQGRFFSRHQLDALPLNGHLHIALSVTGN